MITQALKDAWVAALRSGEYKQAPQLFEQPDGSGYCCLGVLCKVADVPRSKNPTLPSPASDNWDFTDEMLGHIDYMVLARMNDGTQPQIIKGLMGSFVEKKTFSEIADWIEENVPVKAADAVVAS